MIDETHAMIQNTILGQHTSGIYQWDISDALHGLISVNVWSPVHSKVIGNGRGEVVLAMAAKAHK